MNSILSTTSPSAAKPARPRHHHDDDICLLSTHRFLDDYLTDRRKVARRHGDSWNVNVNVCRCSSRRKPESRSWRGRMPTEDVRLCMGGHWHSAGAPCDQGRVPGL